MQVAQASWREGGKERRERREGEGGLARERGE